MTADSRQFVLESNLSVTRRRMTISRGSEEKMMICKMLCYNKLLGLSSQVKSIENEFYLTRQGSAGNLLAEMKTKKDKSKFVHIGSIIEGVLKNYRREPDGELIRVWHVWDNIVGDVISKNANRPPLKAGFCWYM